MLASTTIPALTRFSLIAALCFGLTNSEAQQGGQEAEPVTRKLAVCYLFAPQAPELFFKNLSDDFEQLDITTHRFGAWNEVPLEPRDLTVFREVQDPETGDMVKRPFRTYQLPDGTAPVRLLFYFDSEGQTQHYVLTDPEGYHQPLEVRVINLTQKRAGVDVAGQRKRVGSFGDKVFAPVSEVRKLFPFRFFYEREARKPYVSPEKTLRFIAPKQRLTAILGYRPVYETLEDEEGNDLGDRLTGFAPEMMRFYDILRNEP